MKRILFGLVAIFLMAGCGGGQQNNVSIQGHTASGFDVNKLADVVKKSTNPEVLEKAINDPSNKITNLDLDNDGNIDYLKVVEKGNNQLQVVDDVSNNQSVDVATINVQPTSNNQANLSVQANPTYAGDMYYYHSHISLGDILLLSYLMRPHAYYVPVYHYGYYPHYYTRTRVVTSRPTGSSSSYSRGYGSRSSLSNPTRSQRSFGTRDNSAPVRSGGFGRSRSSSWGSSSGGFGHSSGGFGSRSGFGRSRSGFGRRR